MGVFHHLIYELGRGLRDLALHTCPAHVRGPIEAKLIEEGLDYHISPVGDDRLNVFFGAPECVEVVRQFAASALSDLTPEQDFILGIMLGYDRTEQCARFLKRKAREGAMGPPVAAKALQFPQEFRATPMIPEAVAA